MKFAFINFNFKLKLIVINLPSLSIIVTHLLLKTKIKVKKISPQTGLEPVTASYRITQVRHSTNWTIYVLLTLASNKLI